MTSQPTTDIDYYYDSHFTKEDLMGESIPQFNFAQHLIDVLHWLYIDENWLILGNVNIFQTDNPREYPLAPDVAVWIGLPNSVDYEQLKSWRVRPPQFPPPSVVFEAASKKTWKKDLNEKPQKYATMGVKEYYAYDSNEPQVWQPRTTRLLGWAMANDGATPMTKDERGWLWSAELAHWIVPRKTRVELATETGDFRLTRTDALRAERVARREEQRKLREAERQREETERKFEVEHAELERMRALLREAGIDPDARG